MVSTYKMKNTIVFFRCEKLQKTVSFINIIFETNPLILTFKFLFVYLFCANFCHIYFYFSFTLYLVSYLVCVYCALVIMTLFIGFQFPVHADTVLCCPLE